MKMNNLEKVDLEIKELIDKEDKRQHDEIELIASENNVSEAVLEAMGSVLTNKYAEGYPSKRYYGGCQVIDEVETLAIERMKKLYDADHANVQPHSGSNANFGVYFAVLKPGDTVLGMKLNDGGHLTHGSPVNMSGAFFNFKSYGVDPETERIDYDKVLALAKEHQPKLIVAGASAYSRIIDFKRFKEIADEVGAYLMVDMAHIAGLVAVGLHPNPCEYADFVTTTTHKTLRGPRGGAILCKAEHAKKIDKAIFPGTQGGPLEHIIAAKAVSFKEAMTDEFADYQQKILDNCNAMVERFKKHNYKIVSGGSDNHMFLVDLTNKGVTGKEVEELLGEINITLNKNTIPNEQRSPFVTSGVRIGSPAVTTRGMGTKEMAAIVDIMVDAIEAKESKENLLARVKTLCDEFPIY